MDIVIVLIVMAILYIIPELLRGKKPKEYKYPEIPEVPEIPKVPKAPPVKLEKASHSYPEVVIATDKPVNSSNLTIIETMPIPSPACSITESSVPSINFNQAELLSGVIWAEVLLPPRAHRPLPFKVIQNANRS